MARKLILVVALLLVAALAIGLLLGNDSEDGEIPDINNVVMPEVEYPSRTWYFGGPSGENPRIMYQGQVATGDVSDITIQDGGQALWIADDPAAVDFVLLADTWEGVITLDESATGDGELKVELGYYDDGSRADGGGTSIFHRHPSQIFSKSWEDNICSFSIQLDDSFIVPKETYLAFLITNLPDSDDDDGYLTIEAGSSKTYITAPESAGIYPFPELPTIILFVLGMIAIVSWIILSRKEAESTAIASSIS
ncbi:MAG: hypothetical protein SVY53_15885 [Chloroflexota bacterium]|nr:hypothetical protein [Chloroflexota bacterium]